MTLHEYATTLTKHWIVIVLCALAGAALGFGYGKSQAPTYQSTSSVMVIPEQGENAAELVQGSNYVQNLVASYAVLASSPYVLGPVIDDLGLDESPAALSRRVSVNTPLNTIVIEISVTDGSPQEAKAIADAIAEQLALAVPDLSPQLAEGSPAVRVTTIAEARLPVNPIAPNVRLLTLVGLLAGGATGCAVAVLRHFLTRRVISEGSIHEAVDVPVLGEIVQAPGRTSLLKAVTSAPGDRPAESVRTLLANLRFADVDHKHQVLLISSGDASEGKSSVATSMAISLAEGGAEVLLIDGDLRRPTIATITGLEGSVGLTNVVLHEVEASAVVQPWNWPNLHVLPSGALPPNPGALLASERMAQVIRDLRQDYDVVIIDSAPLLPLSDPLWLSQSVDGVIIVARAGVTRTARLRQTVAGFSRSGTKIVGVVLNGVRPKGRSAYYEPTARRWARDEKPTLTGAEPPVSARSADPAPSPEREPAASPPEESPVAGTEIATAPPAGDATGAPTENATDARPPA